MFSLNVKANNVTSYLISKQKLVIILKSEDEVSGKKIFNHLKLYFPQLSRQMKLNLKPPKPLSTAQYFLVDHDQNIHTLFTIDLPDKLIEQALKQYCQDGNCQLITKGKSLNYVYSQNQNDLKKMRVINRLSLVKDDLILQLPKNTSFKYLANFLKYSNFDHIFIGDASYVWGEKYHRENKYLRGTYVIHQNKRLNLSIYPLEEKLISLIHKHNNFDCLNYIEENQFFLCQNEEIKFKSDFYHLLLENHSNQLFSLSKNSTWTHTELTSVLSNINFNWIKTINPNEISNFKLNRKVSYLFNDQIILTLHYHNQSDFDSIHQAIMNHFRVNHYQLFDITGGNEMLISAEKIPLSQAEIIKRSKLQIKRLDLGAELVNRTNQITAPKNLSYLARNKTSSLSFVSLNAKWWPYRGGLGLEGHLQMFNQENSSVSSGQVNNFKSTMLDTGIQLNYRMFPKVFDYPSIFKSYLGVDRRRFGVESNSSLGELSYDLIKFGGVIEIHKNGYDLSFSPQIGFLKQASTNFQGQTNFNEADGASFKFEFKAAKAIEKNIDLYLKSSLRRDLLSLNNESVQVRDIDINLGIVFKWGEK